MNAESVRQSKQLAAQLGAILQQVSALQIPAELHDIVWADLERVRAILRDRIICLDPGADV